MSPSFPNLRRSLLSFEGLLLLVFIGEVLIFSKTGANFATGRNLFEVLRLSTEIGLLALVMTAVILTGGIDLSVGSLLGLCAVVFGKLWRDAHLAWPMAAAATLGASICGGALNALLIARFRIPPLIVTLGTLSLFRGLAEALTRGVDNFTNFPSSFLMLGQGYLFGVVPMQTLVFLVAVVAMCFLVHFTAYGRAFRAIGFSTEGSRYAGLPVERRIDLVYILAGFAAGVAALIYVARVGQAKADAGSGYELLAITAVVLGGASIFGGIGSIPGTVLGVLVLAVLRIGLTLSDLPGELSGILTGSLLLAVLAAEALLRKVSTRRASASAASVKPISNRS